MQTLKSNLLLLTLCLCIPACQSTKGFNLKTFPAAKQSNLNDLHVIHVNSDRVRQKCLFFNAEAENNWRHQYFMYVLNDKNEVLEIMQPTNQDKDSCYSQLRAVESILQSESQVKICARDELKTNIQDSESQNEFIQFGSLGSRKVVYESLTLDSICNSKKCLSNNEVWVNTCTGFVKQ
ncbi:MAG: hypothetical protein K1X29_06575 [Bdellovibrionales bacterium]|nr:hypothetical protein [Bdellovibrionales bacterium]